MTSFFMALILVALSTVASLAQVSDDRSLEQVRIGVRVDARPFVWWDESTEGYNGFVYDLCLKAVTRAGYLPVEMPVDSQKRSAFFEYGAGEYDLLCDPTTLTLQRALDFAKPEGDKAAFKDYQFSPIYFLANGGHIELSSKGAIDGKGAFSIRTEVFREHGCDKVVESNWKPQKPKNSDASTNESEMVDDAPNLGQWLRGIVQLRYRGPDEVVVVPYTSIAVWGYVGGTSIEKFIKARQKQQGGERSTVCLKVFETHKEAADRFCSGYLARYYGDLDIIRATILEKRQTCEYKESPEQERTYEPYAFVLSSARHPEFPKRFITALYGLFHDGSLRASHRASFPNVEMTSYLNTLFQINDVPSGER